MSNAFILLFLVLFAIFPALALIPLYSLYRPEQPIPGKLVLKSIVLGMFFTLPASFLQWNLPWFLGPLGINLNSAVKSFIIIAFPEEVFKLVAILMLRHFLVRIQNKVDINLIFLAFLMAVGFSLAENIFYLLIARFPLYAAWLRSLTALPLHTLCAGIMALGMLPRPMRPLNLPLSVNLLLAVGLHGLYNLVLRNGRGYNVFLILLPAWLLFLYLMSNLRRKHQ